MLGDNAGSMHRKAIDGVRDAFVDIAKDSMDAAASALVAEGYRLQKEAALAPRERRAILSLEVPSSLIT